MTESCSRAWQAEAVEDGRLSRADEASFERHAEACRACSRERAELARLRLLGERLPALETTPLRRRFLHNELLRRANERALGRARPGFDRKRLLVALAAVCAAVALLCAGLGATLWRATPVATVADGPEFRVVGSPGSRWETLQRGPAVRLALGDGTFTISVRKLHARQGFVAALPDGELEVRGTRFEVEVHGTTRRVTVSEGLVAVRLRGEPERALAAGEAWAAVSPPAGVDRAPAPSASLRAAEPRAPKVRSKAPVSNRAAEESSADVRDTPSAASEFAAAMAAFSRGDFATAEQLFLAFEARYPTNAHVEDTLFLRAVGRLRRGDEAAARALASEYLRRYPSGFRKTEASRMALSK